MKRQPIEFETIFANDVTNKGLTSKICKQFIQFNIKKTPNQPKVGRRPEKTSFQRRHTNIIHVQNYILKNV